jgi:arylsulfatase
VHPLLCRTFRPGGLANRSSRSQFVEAKCLWWLHEGNRALRAGNWKIVAAGKDSPWELYDLATDRSESNNLAADKPEKVRELEELWNRQAEECYAMARKDLSKR